MNLEAFFNLRLISKAFQRLFRSLVQI